MFELQRPDDDGLIKPEVGSWSSDKHYFLQRYIDIFTTGMKEKGWSGLHYIDLFAGAGIEQIRGGGLEWGSPLIAAQIQNRFARLHLCELRKEKYEALCQRIALFGQPSHPHILNTDANEAVHQVVDTLPNGSLSLAFLDPHGLHLNFETLRTLSRNRVDFIIFFPDNLDALRNWKIYAQQPNSNLDRVLGTQDWMTDLEEAAPDRWAHLLLEQYIKQIRSLGYKHFDSERIKMPNGPNLYKLVFCSKHKMGVSFWRKIAKRKPDGQETFDFD